MEVVIQSPSSPTMDNFDFGSNMGSIYHSVPSSPKGFGNYFMSAPTSPSRLSQLYSEFEYFSTTATSSFEAANKIQDDDDDDKDDYSFAFSVSRESDKSSRSAEELFDGGKIKPLNESLDSKESKSEERRGRGKEKLPSSSSNRRVTRSHSPYRWEAEKQQLQQQEQPKSNNKEESSVLSSSSSSKGGSKRWWLKDLLLFRSASEGRGSSKDPLKKYYKKNGTEEVKGSSSFRSSDSSRRKGHVSAHELHYAMKRAESEDMKKRTFLPYRQGILGRLAGFGI
ncbi:uncharacterized protein LOC114193204 [Vigna unguiculata]|uniref:Uncharacterized protein n=1 Tax=Vigna unguiculata TaxID=3917 RepID=A0A4D6MD69_VIGUN|nr:uncharacterized protein LOC114193204 [Vigna unguiculata]QCD98927.1 hypothetical protein DEO72_LG7g205 [Vigna unguiculata]